MSRLMVTYLKYNIIYIKKSSYSSKTGRMFKNSPNWREDGEGKVEKGGRMGRNCQT